MGMRRHPRGDSAFVGVTPTQAGVAYQPAAILNKAHDFTYIPAYSFGLTCIALKKMQRDAY